MNIAIIGNGFVGKALKSSLTNKIQTYLVDPKLNTSVSDLDSFNPDIIFICVPTPMNIDGTQDMKILMEVINEIKQLKSLSHIVIKSTVIPNNLSLIENLIPEVIYNPEFLRERNALEDFINSDSIIFGSNKGDTSYLENFYTKYTKCSNPEYIHTDLITASFVKYTINTFLASKVTFFNEIYNLYKKSETTTDWNSFITILSKDKRIGNSHMEVPGPDGRLGFGGACFPKDCLAFSNYADAEKENLSMLDRVIEVNNKIRNQYKTTSKREKEQNINFNSKRK